MRELRRNTATRVTVGPFYDKTDGLTPETAITVTSCKLTLMVDDGGVPTLVLDTAPTASGGANDMVHVTGDDSGFYDLELAAANVNYLGRAMLSLTDSAVHLPVWHEFMILEESAYDAKYAATDAVPSMGIVDRGQLASVSSTGGALRSAAAFGDDTLIGCVIGVKGSTQGYWQFRVITDNALSGDAFTVDAWTITPSGGTYDYVIYAAAPGSTTNPAPSHMVSAAAGSITASVMAADAIGASELATDAVTEIANAVTEAAITAIKTYNRSANTTASIDGPVSGTNALGVSVDAAYDPIKTL